MTTTDPAPTPTGRTGRPMKIDQRLADGTLISDRIIQLLRAGNYVETAARAAGVNKTSIYAWMQDGARLSNDIGEGRRTLSSLTKKERKVFDFSNAVAAAEAEAEAADVTRLAQIANGGVEIQTVTVKTDGDGNVVEQTTRSDRTLPNPQAIEWRLERRHPTRWGRKQSIEHSGPGGGPVEVHVQAEQVIAVISGVLADLSIAMTDDVRAVVATHLRSMAHHSTQPAEIGPGE